MSFRLRLYVITGEEVSIDKQVACEERPRWSVIRPRWPKTRSSGLVKPPPRSHIGAEEFEMVGPKKKYVCFRFPDRLTIFSPTDSGFFMCGSKFFYWGLLHLLFWGIVSSPLCIDGNCIWYYIPQWTLLSLGGSLTQCILLE